MHLLLLFPLWEGTLLSYRLSPGNSYAYFKTRLPWPLLLVPS